MLITLLIQRKKTALLPLALLLIGWPFISSTLSFSPSNNPDNNSLRILSYNAKLFREWGTYGKFSMDMIKWVANDTSDVKCLQEYSTNANWTELDVTSKIKRKGYKGFIFRADVADREHNSGMAIFSKFEMLDSGVVFQDRNTLNAAIFADINFNDKVVRVYNVHLASMNLELNQVDGLNKIPYVIKRLKMGSLKRSDQIKILIDHANSSPYPYILCGDFNETPYSYAYCQLKAKFKNAFEKAGNGFGFTFNEVPYLLRIDHQFYRSDIKAVHYYVNRTMNISDHFPTFGYYVIPK